MKDKKIDITLNQEDVQNIIDCYEKDIELIEKLKEKIEYLKRSNDRREETIISLRDEIVELEEKNVELRIQISSRETVANDLQERIDNATERLNTLIEFWKKYNPIDNTMQVEQFKGVINILGGKE